ncbi:hypothetical protein AGMMS50249_7130 [candidate division SR1 bacterium]|nr:hypothetical protein AGMMS50249_7130 [candidate division SR1 bacterium]
MPSISTYFSQPLTFSPSQKFFSNQKSLLRKLNFLDSTTLDTHIKYSFQQIEPAFFIQGAEIQGFNSQHEVSQTGIIYKLGFLTPKFPDIQLVNIKLEDVKTRVSNSIFSTIKSFPIIQRLIFLILLFILPFVGKTLFRINLIGLIITLIFSIYKTTKTLLKRKKYQQTSSVGGFDVQYARHTDQLFFSPEMLSAIQNLKSLSISQVAYTGNCLYLYQTATSPALTQHTIQTLSSPLILSILSS